MARATAIGSPGYSIIELMTVVSIMGILLVLAEPMFERSIVKAREAALAQNLFTLRDVIDQYRADRGKYPMTLAELKESGYLKRMPVDPFTKSATSWQEIQDPADGGVFDVRSGSDLVGTNSVPYNSW